MDTAINVIYEINDYLFGYRFVCGTDTTTENFLARQTKRIAPKSFFFSSPKHSVPNKEQLSLLFSLTKDGLFPLMG